MRIPVAFVPSLRLAIGEYLMGKLRVSSLNGVVILCIALDRGPH